MKLISMTDFVIQEWEKDLYTDDFAKVVKNYADFLKEPLKLEMFVSENEENILFKGFDLSTANFHCDRNDRTIEYFTLFEVELTPNAIKRIFG